MRNIRRRDFVLASLLFSAFFFSLAVIGAFHSYSPVPYWDMWDGYLDFYVKASSGDWSAWWSQHNEHRILLSKILFWIDLSVFQGRVWFLIFANYILLALVIAVFWMILKERCPEDHLSLGSFLLIWLSSWAQAENLTEAFQNQFFLAQLLPLSALFMMHKAVSEQKKSSNYFMAACLLGILSLGSMANGVLALPLITVYALATRMGWRRITILAILAGLGGIAYFYDYHSVTKHGSLSVALKNNPGELLAYVLLYLGNPFFLIFGSIGLVVFVAQMAGVVLIILSACCLWQLLHNPRRSSLELALLIFIFYVGATALGTAGGRLIFGVEQAASSRYTTPVLMAWAALFLIYIPRLIILMKKSQWTIWVSFLLLSLGMLPLQLEALDSKAAELFEKKIAALAIEMHIKDSPQILNVYPSVDRVLSVSEVPIKKGISVFGQPPFKNTHERIGQLFKESIDAVHPCQGGIDKIEWIDDANPYMRIYGWLTDSTQKSVSEALWMIDRDNIIIGYALSGQSRPDIRTVAGAAAADAGFKGYVLANQQGLPVMLFDPTHKCSLNVVFPAIRFRLLNGASQSTQFNVSYSDILPGNQWVGSNFQHSSFPGMKVYGSFIQSDADTGSISIRLKRGDCILYRSGPTYGKQYMSLNDKEHTKIVLPVSLVWQVLEFSGTTLPDKFIATLTDAGSGWGEWSAIAVLESEEKE